MKFTPEIKELAMIGLSSYFTKPVAKTILDIAIENNNLSIVNRLIKATSSELFSLEDSEINPIAKIIPINNDEEE